MGKLEEFLGQQEAKPQAKPEGVEWHASVDCQFCQEPVDDQLLYPADKVLVWTCSNGHKSFMENYMAF